MKKTTIFLIIIILTLFNGFLSAQRASSAVPKGSDETTTEALPISVEPTQGYIADTYAIDAINIYTEEDPTYLIFTIDDFQLWATVKGSAGTVLGEFYLPENDVITLTGTGDFTIELYSKSGSGNWKCDTMNETDYDNWYSWDWDALTDFLEDIIAEPLSGYLADKSEIDRISVDTIVEPAHVVFSWDSTMNLFTKIYNEDEELIATYDLSEGNVVSLNEVDVYTFHVYTDEGYGDWSIETYNDEDYQAKFSSDITYDSAKDLVNSFLKDMMGERDDILMDYISPNYISSNYLSVYDYQVNKYYPVDFIIDSYNADTGIVKTRIWGEDKGWIHGLDFKVVWENDKYYLYPGSHSDSYIDPWYNANTYLD